MTEIAWVAGYSAIVVLVSCGGGAMPLLGRVTHSRLQLYLSASAGVMLGAAFFHVMPDAIELCQGSFGWWMSLGVVGMFCIERFIAPHSHEINGEGHHEPADHPCRHPHPHDPHESIAGPAARDHRAAAPTVAGWMAVLGLTIHTFMNGVGLAGAVQAGIQERRGVMPAALVAGSFPGWALFLAIVLHKPADALAISTVLSRKGVSRRKLLLVQAGFAAMVPIGASAFLLAREVLRHGLASQLTGAALAFSAGTFLFIALSDLLPEVQFHQHDRMRLFMALVLGVGFMGAIAYLEPHETAKAAPAENHPPAGPGHGQGAVPGKLNGQRIPYLGRGREGNAPADAAAARHDRAVSRDTLGRS